uniref:Uncharacterized protein n=1 Tax=Chromera velia CCMP2878 TaxID=1169474 RepID=A0A0G4FQI2_9ALVE|eukprot:Cvel_455.t1-p1 / transcript=Cvel_455.t1 / gene=Cvel_455 / organism=Chromera_velia_CCMP2878 / gene_product=Protein TSSC1, putative / transcript_product=Protein TSSC1, putative / location=Cvel_scaffold14:186451-188172(+) / protein_length=574 / sequence_SO=supercontig / SO=protein_coding / is_pseudo=false
MFCLQSPCRALCSVPVGDRRSLFIAGTGASHGPGGSSVVGLLYDEKIGSVSCVGKSAAEGPVSEVCARDVEELSSEIGSQGSDKGEGGGSASGGLSLQFASSVCCSETGRRRVGMWKLAGKGGEGGAPGSWQLEPLCSLGVGSAEDFSFWPGRRLQWDPLTGQTNEGGDARLFCGDGDGIHCLTFGNGDAGSSSFVVLRNREEGFVSEGLHNRLYEISADPLHPNLVIAGVGRDLIGCDVRESRCFCLRTQVHKGAVRTVDHAPLVVHQIASGGEDGRIFLWDCRHLSEPLHEFGFSAEGEEEMGLGGSVKSTAHSHWVKSVRYNRSHDSLLLSASGDTSVRLWRLPPSALEPQTLPPPQVERGAGKEKAEKGASACPSALSAALSAVFGTCGERPIGSLDCSATSLLEGRLGCLNAPDFGIEIFGGTSTKEKGRGKKIEGSKKRRREGEKRLPWISLVSGSEDRHRVGWVGGSAGGSISLAVDGGTGTGRGVGTVEMDSVSRSGRPVGASTSESWHDASVETLCWSAGDPWVAASVASGVRSTLMVGHVPSSVRMEILTSCVFPEEEEEEGDT